MAEIQLFTTDTSGHPLVITLTSMTRAQANDFAAKCKAVLYARCVADMQMYPTMKPMIQEVVHAIIACGCEFPSDEAVHFLMTPSGLEVAIQMMSVAKHKVPVDEVIISKLLETNLLEVAKAVRQLCPFLATGGQTLLTPPSEKRSTDFLSESGG
jgi:hypothetical protein